MNKNDIFKIGIGTWKVDPDNFEKDIEALKYSYELGQNYLPLSMLYNNGKVVEKMKFKEISKFPSIKKDLSILVDKDIPSKDIELKIKKKAGKLLTDIKVFDLYEGKNILNNKKSLAYSLTFSDPARTLQDEEINSIMENVIADLEKSGMELRK